MALSPATFTAMQAADNQVCHVLTPHSTTIKAITGINDCGGNYPEQPAPTLNMSQLAAYLADQGWTVDSVGPSQITVDGQTETRAFLLACDFTTVTPAPLRADLCDGMQAQGFCTTGNCP